MKVFVNIEETLCKTVEVEIPESISDKDEAYIYAKQLVTEAYKNAEIVLDADDFTGFTNIEVIEQPIHLKRNACL